MTYSLQCNDHTSIITFGPCPFTLVAVKCKWTENVFVKTESLLLETVKSATYNNARFQVLTAASIKFVKNTIFVHREFRTS
jgi:hypothetical protein